MTDEVPVNRTDLLILLAVSVGGGFLIASLILTPELSPQFLNTGFVGTMLLAFFLFIPVMGIRLFLDDSREE
ncbi:hypothetical protein GS429_02985 [Natronorubrum sp. JWXQ-INN-674]|uniref:Uncharacterized protein n=1 Tax=Natronorubrum halalkaliphilum TaxID=2691917 RepID=A0A6B0VKF6_9EURY|nr:hypothetical protein [Natronorubrum halalkaliphilum]MXV61039.1 hypothetical protein [Natronorubrum halalkaliphilum]